MSQAIILGLLHRREVTLLAAVLVFGCEMEEGCKCPRQSSLGFFPPTATGNGLTQEGSNTPVLVFGYETKKGAHVSGNHPTTATGNGFTQEGSDTALQLY